MAKDLTRGGIARTLLVTALPTMIGFGAQILYDVVDIYWIARISADAVAGVTVFSTLFWVIEALNEVIGVSSISLIAQAYGRKDIDLTNLTVEQTITFKFAAAAVAAVLVAIFIKPLMLLFVKPEVAAMGLEYGYIRLFFLPIMFSSYTCFTALRCLGDANSPMRIMIFAGTLNAVLDPFFIFARLPVLGLPGLNLGLFGAALATVISQTVSFLLGFYLIFSGRKGIRPSLGRLFRLNREIAVKLITIGLPSGVEVLLRNLAHTVVLGFVAAFGSAAVAAAGIGGRLLGFSFMFLTGLSFSGSAMIGQSLGAEDLPRAEKTARIAGAIAAGIMSVLALAAVFFGRDVAGLFARDAATIEQSRLLLITAMTGFIFLGYGIGLGTAFVGAGYNLPLLAGGLVSRWAVQIPALLLAVRVLHLPLIWVWLTYTLGDLGQMLTLLGFYRWGKWRTKRVWAAESGKTCAG